LREVREAVAGYRQPRLLSELDGARQLLQAAGIEYSVEQAVEELPPSTDAVLAWVVREGVTNVIRHSRARHCLIRLTRENGTIDAEVINDGELRQEQDAAWRQAGSGLSGLRERITALGGRIEALPIRRAEPGATTVAWPGKEGFRLWVELPVQSSAMSRKEKES